MRSRACLAALIALASTSLGRVGCWALFLFPVGSPVRSCLLGNITAFHRMPAPLAMTSIAVKTCVPSGWSGLSIVTGISNSGAKPCRTKIFFSLRLTNMANCPERLAGCSAAQ